MNNEYIVRLLNETLMRAQNIYECRYALTSTSLETVIADLKDSFEQIKENLLEVEDLAENENFNELCKMVKQLKRYYKTLVVPTKNNDISSSLNA